MTRELRFGMDIDFRGMEELVAGLGAAPELLYGAEYAALTDSLLLLEAEIKDRTPRDTGRLQAAWRSDSSHEVWMGGFGEELTGHVSNPLPYAGWIERGDPDTIYPVRAKALHFWYQGVELYRQSVKSPKAHMASEGLEASRFQIVEIFKTYLRAALDLVK